MVIALRHASTDWNLMDPEILRGGFDPPLNRPMGIAEAERAAGKLARYAIAEVHTSRFLRDYQTAEIVARRTGARLIVSAEMDPWPIGNLAGQPRKAVWPYMASLIRNPSLRPPGGGSWGDFLMRWAGVVRCSMAWSRQTGRNRVLVVQGSVIRALPTILYGRPPRTDKQERVKTAQMVFLN